jgi:hypothetical protein
MTTDLVQKLVRLRAALKECALFVEEIFYEMQRIKDPGYDLVTLRELRQRHVIRVLERVGNNKTRAARILNCDPKTVSLVLKEIRGERKPTKISKYHEHVLHSDNEGPGEEGKDSPDGTLPGPEGQEEPV